MIEIGDLQVANEMNNKWMSGFCIILNKWIRMEQKSIISVVLSWILESCKNHRIQSISYVLTLWEIHKLTIILKSTTNFCAGRNQNHFSWCVAPY